jgi:enhancing lycopene biosynthesis protein 2
MSRRVAVILSGAGYLDGSEIHEAVLSLYFLEKGGAEPLCFAPDRDQFHVVDHRTGEVTRETRNALVEAARIARGRIRALRDLELDEVDAVVMPGGYGAAKNLSDFAWKGKDCSVDTDLQRVLADALAARKPVVAICIAPAILAAALRRAGSHGVTLTIGEDPATAATVEALGARHQTCPVDRIVVDETHRVISTPAYMYESGPGEVGKGIELAIQRLLAWLAASPGRAP